jgi:hypothetical protein
MRLISIRTVLFAVVVLFMSAASFGQVRISVSFGPPALPVYEQPICPGDGYIWTPGYWDWSDDDSDYYWVPGTWVLAPEVGYLWTPPYWAWVDGAFVFYDGYWGPQVGFYGGINYGFGYFGEGLEGGRWDNGRFFYNRSVTNVNVTVIHNVYNTTVVNNNTTVNRVSYNGGNGGISARPTSAQEAAMRERHIPPAAAQVQQVQAARGNRELRASANHGKPPVAATARPGEFSGREAVPAREAGAPYNPPANRRGRATTESRPAADGGGAENSNRAPENGNRPSAPIHAKDLPPMERPTAPNTGNQKADQKYQQQQEKMQQQQQKERQKLQQQQEKEDQRLSQQKANDAQKQQTEQRHQQQTQQLQQRHTDQQQRMQQRQPPPSRPEGKPPKG